MKTDDTSQQENKPPVQAEPDEYSRLLLMSEGAEPTNTEEAHAATVEAIMNSVDTIEKADAVKAATLLNLAEYHMAKAAAIRNGTEHPKRPVMVSTEEKNLVVANPEQPLVVENAAAEQAEAPKPEATEATETIPQPFSEPQPAAAETAETKTAETTPAAADPVVQDEPTSTADKRFFKKLVMNQAFSVGGRPVQFEPLANNVGVKALTVGVDDEEIAALTKAGSANNGKGTRGIVIIDAATYANLKKNLPYRPKEPKSQPRLRVWDSNPKLLKRNGKKDAPVAAEPDANNGQESSGQPRQHRAPGGSGGRGAEPRAGAAPSSSRASDIRIATAGKKSGPVMRPPSTGRFRSDAVPTPPKI